MSKLSYNILETRRLSFRMIKTGKGRRHMPHFLKVLTLSLTTLSAHALVDYTEKEAFVPQQSGASATAQKAPVSRSVTKPKRQARGAGLGLELNSGVSFGTQDIEVGATNGKASTMGFDAQIQTRFNVFMAASYFQMKSDDRALAPSSNSFQKGNPELLIGFNWLQFGRPQDLATVDLYGGLSFGQKGSDFATSRSDKIVGVSTAKRFHTIGLGLGYEMRLTEEPESGELSIGNISKLSASLGWVVSNDIRFLVEGSSYTVGSSDSASGLQEDVKFAILKPQLQLKLSPLVDLSLGATLRTRRLKDETLTGARLWNIQGAYGSGLFAGLSINI